MVIHSLLIKEVVKNHDSLFLFYIYAYNSKEIFHSKIMTLLLLIYSISCLIPDLYFIIDLENHEIFIN